jgi:hypothetical protein
MTFWWSISPYPNPFLLTLCLQNHYTFNNPNNAFVSWGWNFGILLSSAVSTTKVRSGDLGLTDYCTDSSWETQWTRSRSSSFLVPTSSYYGCFYQDQEEGLTSRQHFQLPTNCKLHWASQPQAQTPQLELSVDPDRTAPDRISPLASESEYQYSHRATKHELCI